MRFNYEDHIVDADYEQAKNMAIELARKKEELKEQSEVIIA